LKHIRIILLLVLGLIRLSGLAQVEVRGTVYDQSQLFAMPGVSVMGTSGQGTTTDSLGRYKLKLPLEDSIYFSYLGRRTAKFPVKRIARDYPLDMSLAVRVDSLPLVVVRPKPYRYDSAENRDEYRKVFEYQPDYVVGGANGGVGFNLDMLFNAKKNRQILSLQRRLLEEEQDKYVDYRFNKNLVKRITGLQRPAIDSFMRLYRPSYQFIRNCENDYEFYKYIKDCSIYFLAQWKQEHPYN
jgi:hypothetical protein